MRSLAYQIALGLALAGCGSAAENQGSSSVLSQPEAKGAPPPSASLDVEETLVELVPPPPLPGTWLLGVPLSEPRLTVDGVPLDAMRWEEVGVFRVIEDQMPLARVVVERKGVELWLWVNATGSTGAVTTGRTVLHLASDGPPIGVLAGGLPIGVSDSELPANVELLFEALSSWVEVEGWLPSSNAGLFFRRESPPLVEGREVELTIPQGEEVTIVSTPGGKPIARLHQGIAAFRAIVRGSSKQGHAPISLLIESWEGPREGELLGRIDGYIAAQYVGDVSVDGEPVVESEASMPGRVFAGSELDSAHESAGPDRATCVVDPASQKTVGRVVGTVEWHREGRIISLDELELELVEGGTCPSPFQKG